MVALECGQLALATATEDGTALPVGGLVVLERPGAGRKLAIIECAALAGRHGAEQDDASSAGGARESRGGASSASLGALVRLLSWHEEGIVEKIIAFCALPWKSCRLLYPIQNQPGVLTRPCRPPEMAMPADEVAAEVAALRIGNWQLQPVHGTKRLAMEIQSTRAMIVGGGPIMGNTTLAASSRSGTCL